MTIQYKGYIAKAEIDEDEKMIVGRVINMGKDGITTVISYFHRGCYHLRR